MNVKITRAGGYDPKLGPAHPSNQDPTLEQRKSPRDACECKTGQRCDVCGTPIRDEVRAAAREVEDLAVQLKAALAKSTRLWNRGSLTARERRELTEARRTAEKAVL